MTALTTPNAIRRARGLKLQTMPAVASGAEERRHLARLRLMDFSTALGAGLLAYALRFDLGVPNTEQLITAIALPVVWLILLLWTRTYEMRFLHTGGEETRRILHATTGLVLVTALVSYVFKLEVARGYLLALVVVTTGATLAGRWVLRTRLAAQRRKGLGWTRKVVVAGDPKEVSRVVAEFISTRGSGFEVTGVCLTADHAGQYAVPVTVGMDSVAAVAVDVAADAVVVLPCTSFGPADVRRLGWQLEASDIHMLVGPALTDIARQRTTVTPVGALSLLHIHPAELSGGRRLVKGAFDRVAAAFVLVLVSPLLLAMMIAIRLQSPGPALFRQVRVGRQDRPFTVLKLRTMSTDAEALKLELLDVNQAGGVLFKIHNDPRVTKLGVKLRRYSIDELPQLINVVKGQMSLVGPRPALVDEVELYQPDERRRLVVKPGLTGLWQVSGRSDLPWEESVRLDLKYVDNWSFALDLRILWRTVRAVLTGAGAY